MLSQSRMIFKIAFGSILLLLGTFLYIIVLSEPPAVDPIHPEYKTMLLGSSEMNTSIRHPAEILGVLIFIVLSLACLIGLRKTSKRKNWRIRQIAVPICLGFVAIIIFLMASYWRSLSAEKPTYFLGFPTASAWMLYGVFLFPLLLTLLYTLNFDEWILSDAELEEFRQLIKS